MAADKIPLTEQIAAATAAHEQRSVHWLVARGGLTQDEAEREHKRMAGVIATLTWLKNNPDKVRR